MPHANVRIVRREKFTLLGYCERFKRAADNPWPVTLEEQWDTIIEKGHTKALDQTNLGGGLYGAYIDCAQDGSYGYMVGCEVPAGTIAPQGLITVEVMPMDYAVNRGDPVRSDKCCDEVGPLLISLHEWLMQSPYQQGCESRLAFYEFYKNPDRNKLSVVEIWIPIIKQE